MARYIVYEDRLRRNGRVIDDVARRTGVEVIMAFKANALWRTFDIMADYCPGFTASSLNELRLGCDCLGGSAHAYCPVYTPESIGKFLKLASHITFNSLTQLSRYSQMARSRGVSVGLRVNPGCQIVDTDIYNPTLPGTRFGVRAADLPADLDVDGLHFHCLCESSALDTRAVIEAFEQQFGPWIDRLKWVNMGGGHLMTRRDYDVELLVGTLRAFCQRHPGLKVILEPGSAWTWQTGDLEVEVLDIVTDSGINTAIIDASFACHMPDTLEMPYKPAIAEESQQGEFAYRLGGNSCRKNIMSIVRVFLTICP